MIDVNNLLYHWYEGIFEILIFSKILGRRHIGHRLQYLNSDISETTKAIGIKVSSQLFEVIIRTKFYENRQSRSGDTAIL